MLRVLERVRPAVVEVSGGSGVIVSPEGLVMSCAHVGERAGRQVTMTLADGRKVRGETLGNDRLGDAGLMRITESGPWPHVPVGKSADVAPGQWCVALSYPMRFGPRGRPLVRVGRVLDVTSGELTTDCVIMGGDSGGPLFNLDGEVVGISSYCDDTVLRNVHIASDHFQSLWEQLLRGEDLDRRRRGRRGVLGMIADRESEAARVAGVIAGSPAEKAGIREGDVIVRFHTEQVAQFADLLPLIRQHEGRESVEVQVRRGEELVTMQLRTASTPPPPPPRQRTRGPRVDLERVRRDAAPTLDSLGDALRAADAATVQIVSDGKDVALGTIVDADGWIVTKSSLLDGTIACRLADGRELPATRVGFDEETDLALVRVEATGLKAAPWLDGDSPTPGHMVAATSGDGEVLTLGAVSDSVTAIPGDRRQPRRRRGWLGITLGGEQTEREIVEVSRESPAFQGGLRAGDLVLRLDGQEMTSTEQIIENVGRRAPNDKLKLVVRRDGEQREFEITLGKWPVNSMGDEELPEDSWGGGPFSERRRGFPLVLTHDLVLDPDECGGPLVDLEGRVVGVNIARALRVSSFAIPAAEVQRIVERLRSKPTK